MVRICPRCAEKTSAMLCDFDQAPTLRLGHCADATIAPGSRLADHYVIETEIGRGAVGRVFAARDEQTGSAVAIKTFSPAPGGDGRDMSVRFAREAAITAGLREPHTVAMLDYGCTSTGELFAVMERLEGENLQARLERFV